MFIAFAIVLVLVAASPVLVMLDQVALADLVPILAAVGLVSASREFAAAGRRRIRDLVWLLGAGAMVLAVWILVQILPLPIANTAPLAWLTELAHPVWESAAGALQKPIAGRITVDTGVSVIALVHLLSFVGVAVLTMAVTLDRSRAEVVLVGLTLATAVIALVVGGADLLGIASFAQGTEALDTACLGLVLASACGALVYARGKSERRKRGREPFRFGRIGVVALLTFLVSLVAILAARSGSLVFAASGGLATFLAVVVVRRLALGRWGAVAIGATAVVIGVALIAGAAGTNPDPRLAFVKTNPVSLELTQRILADAPLLGTGAGTFRSLVPIYRPADPGAASLNAVTAAAKISIELGRPVLWLSVAAAVVMALFLLRGALRRGRDHFYAAAGAASLVTLTLLAFVNVGLFGSGLSLLVAVVLGLALAQVEGRETMA